jgi:hypothetical protein
MNGSTSKNLSLSDHPAIREFQNIRRLETKIELLELELRDEKRDHRQTAIARDIWKRRVEYFERMTKTLAARIDKLEVQK